MEIQFGDRKLEEAANDFKLLKKKYGLIGAKIIRRRLDDLAAAKTLEDCKMLPGRCHPLKEDRKGQFGMDVEHPDRLIFIPEHNPLPVSSDGTLIWSQVTRIKIIEITDYHGK